MPCFLAPIPELRRGPPAISISVRKVSLAGPAPPIIAASAICAIYLRDGGLPVLGGLPAAPVGVLPDYLLTYGVDGFATSSS